MGKVYRARVVGAAGFEKVVALKFMLPRKSGDADSLRMFQEEARLAASLTHANIVGILDFGVRGGNWYLAMEYVPGANLRVLLDKSRERQRPLTTVLAAFVAAEIARGLHYAHTRSGEDGKPLGVVHRDVSPQNVVVSWTGEVKVLDFGIALARNRAPDTDSGVVRGKFAYMSPEQALGEAMDFRSDIFSLGSLLYEMLTGEKAFPQPGMKAALAVASADFLPPDRLRRDLPVKLVSIVLRAMAKDSFDRYLSAGEMLNDLTGWIAEQRSRGGNEDESASLARWAEQVFDETTGGNVSSERSRDFTWSDDALSEDSTRSGEDEWVPPTRSALLGPGVRARLDAAPAGPRATSGAFAAPPPDAPSPRVTPRRAMIGAGALGAVALAIGLFASFRTKPVPAPTPVAVTSATATAAPSATFVVASVDSAERLALVPVPVPSARARHIGLLQVTSIPTGARVFLDGAEISDAPVLIPNLAVPQHYAVEVRKAGFAFWGREVDLADDERVGLVATLARPGDADGHVTFEIPDGLQVVLDGKIVGTGPATVSADGQPGGHQVHVHDRDGKLVKEFTLELRSKETTLLSLSAS